MDLMLARTRGIAWVFFFAACLGAWIVLFNWSLTMDVDLLGFPEDMSSMGGMQAGDMAASGANAPVAMPSMPAPNVPMDGMPMEGAAMSPPGGMDMGAMMNMSRFEPLFLMWAVMMAAMMLPTFLPTARIFMDLLEAEIARPIGLFGLTAGYMMVWFGVAATLAIMQVGLVRIGLTGPMGQSLSPWFSASLLIVAGLYQFTAFKERCAQHCRSPLSFFLAEFRPGLRGGLRLGRASGLYCAGCCWGLMAIGFAGGTMSLLWMGLATLLMVLEKLPDIGRWLTTPIGIGLVALGLWVAGDALL